MTNRIANPQSVMAAASGARNLPQAVRFFLFPFSFLICGLVLCLAMTPVRANAFSSVVTFTNVPGVVSNTYNGVITLQINGLTNGVTNVVVQKFLDANTNGVIDSGDLLVQQFRLAVGQANVFTNLSTMAPVTVTNFMPGDASSTTDQITVPLNFQNGDFAQSLVGQYLYKISSPSGGFASVTNRFVVTNAFFSSYVTGAVVNVATAPEYTNIPNAVVLLCLNQNGAINVQAGTVANNAGLFSLRAPPGDYFFAVAKSNFVEDVTQEGIQISANTTNNYDIGLNPATTNITGRIINAATSNGLAGVSGMVISTNNLLSFYFTDTNGYFYAPVVSSLWEAPVDPFAAAFQGALTWQFSPFFTVSNKVVNFTNALPPATAIFYGVVSNSSAVPMPGVYLYAADNAGHQSVGMTDSHGKYVVGVLAGTNQWQLSILSTNNPGITNSYVVGPGSVIQAGGLQPGQAVQQNFSLLFAPYTISGTVADLDGNRIAGVEIFATNANDQAFSVWTASDGTYLLNVSLGTWTVGINPASLENAGYTNIPANQSVTVSGSGSGVSGVNFTIEVCGEIEILTTNLPDGMVGQYYNANIAAESCQNITNWSTAYGITLTSLHDQTNFTYPAGTPIYSDSQIIGYVGTYFSFGVANNQPYATNVNATVEPDPNAPDQYYFVSISATVDVSGPIAQTNQITFGNGNGATVWTALPTTQNSDGSYSAVVTLPRYPVKSDNYIYYNGSFTCSSGSLMYNTAGTPSNRVAFVSAAFHSIPTAGNAVNVGSSIPYTNADNSVAWIQSGTNLGQYLISAYGPQSTNMDGLSLYPDGTSAATISGTPISIGTNGGTFNFTIMAEDASSDVTVQPLSLFVYPATGITTGASSVQVGQLQSSNIFQMQLTGMTNEFNYTVLMSTNLASTNWVPIATVNNPTTNSMSIPDDSATNSTRFYRLQISQ